MKHLAAVLAIVAALVLVGCGYIIDSSAGPAQRRISTNTPGAKPTATPDIDAQRAHELQVACLEGGGVLG